MSAPSPSPSPSRLAALEASYSPAEEEFAVWLRAERISGWTREHRFAAPRRWRFDYAWPPELVAVEIEGVVWSGAGGRHQRAAGFVADCEKYEAALAAGWRVYRVPALWVVDGGRRVWRREVMVTLRGLLDDTSS